MSQPLVTSHGELCRLLTFLEMAVLTFCCEIKAQADGGFTNLQEVRL